MTIRLLIVDDHKLVREGLRLTFAGTEIDVVAEAADGKAAFEQVAGLAIDVALVDVRMPVADGFYFLERLQQTGSTKPAVLMHTVNDGGENVRRSRQLGARGLLVKGQDAHAIQDAIRRVHAGEQVWEIV